MWLSIDHRLTDTNRYQLTNFIDRYRLIDWFSVPRFPSIGYPGKYEAYQVDQKAYWVQLSVQKHSRSCFHVDFVQCDSCLEIVYDILKWPCERKNLGLKRCCVANSLSGNHRVCLLVGLTQFDRSKSHFSRVSL